MREVGKPAKKTGFETAIEVEGGDVGPYFYVNALDSEGKALGESEVVKVSE